jgi:hypothetical protein
MAGESASQNSPTTLRWRCNTNHGGSFDIFPVKFIDVIEPPIVEILSEKFDRHLGSMFIICRHIDIVYQKDNGTVLLAPK